MKREAQQLLLLGRKPASLSWLAGASSGYHGASLAASDPCGSSSAAQSRTLPYGGQLPTGEPAPCPLWGHPGTISDDWVTGINLSHVTYY